MKRMSVPTVLALFLLTATTAWATETTVEYGRYYGFTAITGSPGNSDAEGIASLVDGKTYTKWCVTTLGNPTFIEFNSSLAFVPTGYRMITGNDTGTYPHRNPVSWTVKGKLHRDDEWTTLATETDNYSMPQGSGMHKDFSITGNSNPYQYFRFEVSKVERNLAFQLSEFQFLGTAADASKMENATITSVETYYVFTGEEAVSITPVVKDAAGNTLTIGTDYTLYIGDNMRTNVLPVTFGTEGDFTLTFNGNGNYTGEQAMNITIGRGIPVTSEMTLLGAGTYKVYDDVTINSRITISGNVVLNLGEGSTLTATKGIELGNGNTLTINGPGALSITNPDTDKAGIGAESVGQLIINGGTITVNGGWRAAAIGGSTHNSNGGTITINGGIVTATARGGGSGIGGGINDWDGHYGNCGTININGGQVTAIGENAWGIGPGWTNAGERYDNTSGSVSLSYSNADTDFIQVTGGYGGFNEKISTLSFAKQFIVEGSNVTPTTVNDVLTNCKLIPKTDAMSKTITYAVVTGVSDTYNYTASTIDVTPVLYDVNGQQLTKGSHYLETLKRNGSQVNEVDEVGDYTYTFTAISGSGYTGERTFSFSVIAPAPTNLVQTAYSGHSASLSWTENGNATEWKVQYSTNSEFTAYHEHPVSDTPSTTLENLMSEATNYVRVKSVLNSTQSYGSEMIKLFTTDKTWLGFGSTHESESFELPLNTNFKHNMTEQLYKATELGRAGLIQSIDFKVDKKRTHHLDIYMVHSNKTKFTSENDWIRPTETDKVFSGTVSFVADEWTAITFDTPFAYNGTQNVVLIVVDNTDVDQVKSSYFLTYIEGKDRVSMCITSNAVIDATNSSGSGCNIKDSRNQIRVGFLRDITLADDADNTNIIEKVATTDRTYDVTLSDRTLWKDGNWNTLCLPFAVDDFTDTPLEGSKVMEMKEATFSGSTLTLNFDEATSIEAGTPYLVKWTSVESYVPYDGTNADVCSDIVNPTFKGVTVNDATNDVSCSLGDDMTITFCGTYIPVSLEADDRSVLYLGADDKLFYPSIDMTIGAQRAYFKLVGLTAGELTSTETGQQEIKAFVLNFGDEETGIQEINLSNSSNPSTPYFTLDGLRIGEKPSNPGLYIHNGRKVMVNKGD